MKRSTPPSLLLRFISELVGTYVLLLIVIAAYFMAMATGGGSLTYAVSYGVALALVIIFFGQSSRQFNPIISLTLLAIRKQRVTDCLVAIVGQLLAAIAAAWTLLPLIDLAQGQVQALVPQLTPETVSLALVTVTEGIGVLLLVLAYLHVARREDAPPLLLPVLAGLSVIPGAAIGMVVSGGSLNPMRVVGAALVSGGAAWQYHWVFWVGPLLAAILAVVYTGTVARFSSK